MNDKRIYILGTQYEVLYRKPSEYDDLDADNGGICDADKKKIVINTEAVSSEGDEHCKAYLRHEIIHAYLFESGLGGNWEHFAIGHDETYVDWIALQFPKMYRTFREVGCI